MKVMTMFPSILAVASSQRTTAPLPLLQQAGSLFSEHWCPSIIVPLYLFIFLDLRFIYLFIYLFIYGCAGSPPPREGPLQPRQAGATPHHGARASHHRGLSRCGAQAPDTQAQQSWLTGPAAPRHAGPPQTRARTRVPRTGRQALNHCTTREAPPLFLIL